MDNLVQFVRGIMRTATENDWQHNKFSDLLEQIAEVDVREYGVEDNENVTIDIPMSFFASKSTGYKLKLAAIAGSGVALNDADTRRYQLGLLVLRLKHEKERNTNLELRATVAEDQYEEALEALTVCNESGFYGNGKPKRND